MALAVSCGRSEPNVANLSSEGNVIVAFGDSITYGYGVKASEAFPAVLGELLGAEVINAGQSGDTTGTALHRLEDDVLSLEPRLVIVELGGNDFLNKVPKEETFRNMDRIVSACANGGAMVVVVHIKTGVWSDPYRDRFEEIAEKHGALLVPNIMSGVFGRPSMMYDQIHPNAQGHEMIAGRIAEFVGPLLERADVARQAVQNEISKSG
ncbi:MAG: arylesterase [Candidatus Hydrogenedentes bacterium]|nr:arylesterase [Candidatus Hydrogenedentota bacterium]